MNTEAAEDATTGFLPFALLRSPSSGEKMRRISRIMTEWRLTRPARQSDMRALRAIAHVARGMRARRKGPKSPRRISPSSPILHGEEIVQCTRSKQFLENVSHS